jgi:hypothetical protein
MKGGEKGSKFMQVENFNSTFQTTSSLQSFSYLPLTNELTSIIFPKPFLPTPSLKGPIMFGKKKLKQHFTNKRPLIFPHF